MSEPSSVSLLLSGTSCATVMSVFWRVVRKLPRWKRQQIKYRVVSYSAVRLRDDLWVVNQDGIEYLTTDRDAMDEFLARVDGPPPRRAKWPGPQLVSAALLGLCIICQQAAVPAHDACADRMFGRAYAECSPAEQRAVESLLVSLSAK